MPFVAPTLDDFRERFPEFDNSEDETITLALQDAQVVVGQTWLKEADYKLGILYLAAHYMQIGGGAYDTGGLSSFSVGAISVTYAGRSIGSFESTSYGARFRDLLGRNRGGPIVI